MIEAALRAGESAFAQALVAERQAMRPDSHSVAELVRRLPTPSRQPA
jgi:hypothetical protein